MTSLELNTLQRLLRSMPHGFGDLRVIQTEVVEDNPLPSADMQKPSLTKEQFTRSTTSAKSPDTEAHVAFDKWYGNPWLADYNEIMNKDRE